MNPIQIKYFLVEGVRPKSDFLNVKVLLGSPSLSIKKVSKYLCFTTNPKHLLAASIASIIAGAK